MEQEKRGKGRPAIERLTRYDLAIAKRYSEFRKAHIGSTQKEAAKRLNRSQGDLSNMETGSRAISHSFINELVEKFLLNKRWLITGKGEMLITGKGEKTNTLIDVAKLTNKIDDLEMQVELMSKNLHRIWEVLDAMNKSNTQLEQEIIKLRKG